MKTIKLMSMSIRNFKGCESLDLKFNGCSAVIYGDNAAGKTTVYDALTWLLFGKDSRGRGDFEIKPLDAAGQVKDHAAVSEVSADFYVDGANVNLRRTFFERWSTKRGCAEASYDGNTGEYYVDDVPSKKYEYERRVAELVDEDLFRMLTNVSWFCEGMDWKNRRKALLEICKVPDDRGIMAENTQFASLSAAMGLLSLEDYKKKLAAQRKGLNGTRSTIPVRLDEQKKTIETLSCVDFASVQAERDARVAHLDALNGELVKLGHGTLLDTKRNEIGSLRNELERLRHENDVHRASQMVPVVDERPAMNAALVKAKQDFSRCASLAEREKQLIGVIEQAIEKRREQWQQADRAVFEASVCAVCGQKLPVEAQRIAKESFEEDMARRKADAVAGADREKVNLAAAKERRETYINEAVAAENECARLEAALAGYVPEEQPEIVDLPDYREKSADLMSRIRTLEEDIRGLESESAAIREEINRKIAALRTDIEKLDRELAKRALLDFARQREEELRQEAKKSAEELEMLDKQLFLCDEFTRFKVGFIEDSINGKFRLARFKLFDEQVNGGLADCCEATYDGVPYSDLNSGMRINLGVDVIRTISEHHGLRVPLVVDNAESVVSLLDAGTQVIRLLVSGKDKELRCEYED